MSPLPRWLTVVVVLTILALLAWNIVVVGPEAYPTSLMLGGLLAGYTSVNELLKRKSNGNGKGGDDS